MNVRQRRLLYVLAPLVICTGLAIETRASCPTMEPGAPCMEFWRADAVFIGLATRVERIANQTGLEIGPYVRTTAYFNVEEAFRGADRPAIVFELDHCGYLFKEGERYLVYAYRNLNSKKLEVRAGNTRTRPLAEAGEDLQYIRGVASENGARVFGRILLQNLNVKESQYTLEPVQNVKVTLEGNDQRLEVVSDSEGKYEFNHVPAGTYKLRAEFPEHYGSMATSTINVSGHGCVRNEMSTARRNSDIAGRVLDQNGKPIAGVPVSLVPADVTAEQLLQEDKDKSLWTFMLTNDEGEYWFSDLAPGRYVVVINRAEFERSRGAKVARRLPRFFYPGVTDVTGAIVIVTGEDELVQKEYDFHLPVRE